MGAEVEGPQHIDINFAIKPKALETDGLDFFAVLVEGADLHKKDRLSNSDRDSRQVVQDE
jgi:hypothetical protein